MFKTRR